MTVDRRGLHDAMARYATLKGKSDADVVNKAMRFWLPFAGNKVKRKTPGVAKVRRDLRSVARNPIASKFKRVKGTWAGTLAAGIIASRLKARGRLSKKVTPDFWEIVDRFAEAKFRSVNYLRAGFIPAYRKFNVPKASVAGQEHFSGNSKGIKAIPSLIGRVEAFATNQRQGAAKMVPDAFTSSIPEVRAQFIKWIEADIRANAIRSGFY